MNLSRRKLLGLGAAAGADMMLETQGYGIVSLALKGLGYIGRRVSYRTAEEVARYLESEGIKLQKEPRQNGNRTLMVVGESHMGIGNHYSRFFPEVDGHIGLDVIFFENTYADGNYIEDPMLEAQRDAFEINRMRKATEEEMAEIRSGMSADPTGYYGLSKRFRAKGLEERDTWRDSCILSEIERLTKEVGLYPRDDSGTTPADLERFNRRWENAKMLVPTLRTTELRIPQDLGVYEFNVIQDSLKKAYNETVIDGRNKRWARIIDSEMMPFEVGATIMGSAHINPGFHKHDGVMSILDRLDSIGVSHVMLDMSEVVKFCGRKFGKTA